MEGGFTLQCVSGLCGSFSAWLWKILDSVMALPFFFTFADDSALTCRASIPMHKGCFIGFGIKLLMSWCDQKLLPVCATS